MEIGIGLGGFLIGIVGIIISYKSRVVAKPQYTLESITLIDIANRELPKEVKMLYDDKEIKRLTKTTLLFFNRGTKVIKKSDISSDMLQIDFSENDTETTHIFRAEITKCSRRDIGATVNISENNDVVFGFNYLGYRDYFFIEILHSASKTPKQVIGEIKEFPKAIVTVSSQAEKQNEMILDFLLGHKVKYILKSIFGKGT